MKQYLKSALGAASILALAMPAIAQDAANDTQTAEASECMQQLQQLAESMQEDGYWLSGYRGYGTVGVMSPSGARGTAPVGVVEPDRRIGELQVQPEGTDTTQDVTGGPPWAGVRWEQRPQFEIGVLYRAAYVLAQNGDEQTCQVVADATQQRYQGYVDQLQELGVEPHEVTTWRQAALAAAEPVTELQGRFRVEDIIGSDIRNAEDRSLGSIEDVLLDSQTGEVQYVIVDHGGFFGIGGEEVVLPWQVLRATAGLNTFVLPVQEAALEQAPRISDNGGFLDTQETGSIDTEEVDSYWDEALNQ